MCIVWRWKLMGNNCIRVAIVGSRPRLVTATHPKSGVVIVLCQGILSFFCV